MDANGWISVKDRLPEPGTRVLLATRSGEVVVVKYNPVDARYPWRSPDGQISWTGEGAHWQPLPPPPVVGEGG